MEEAELVRQLSHLKGITPRHEWVVFSRTRIVTEGRLSSSSNGGKSPSNALRQLVAAFHFTGRPAFVLTALAMFVVSGLLGQVAQASLPGDPLYTVRTSLETIRLAFAPAEQRGMLHFQLAQERLEDLEKVTQANKVWNLPSAIREYQESEAAAARELGHLAKTEPAMALGAAELFTRLQHDKSRLEQVLGVSIGNKEAGVADGALAPVVEQEIAYHQSLTLNEGQRQLLEQAKVALQAEEYTKALEVILSIPNASASGSGEEQSESPNEESSKE